MHARLALLAVASLVFAGCISLDAPDGDDVPTANSGAITSVHERNALPFVVGETWSHVLEEGLYGILPVESIFVDVALPISEGGSAVDGSAVVHMGLWLPDVPAGTKVPIIADVGPYYSDGDVHATEPANRLGKFLIENFVPHGYGVAQVSVFGSGESTHCMDLMGNAEQLGVDAAVTYLGTQEWSNGNVGLIGRSYDGSTPWQAAMFGNPALKTIVPISGLIGMHELMWRNGSAEFRGPIMHNVVYGTFGVDSDPMTGDVNTNDAYNLCPDYMTGAFQGAGAYATGDHFAPAINDYWSSRYFLDRALANYEGSVYFIHGMQDWNVDPHMAFPAYHQLEDAGIEVKGLFGQWAHHYPDRASEHENLRTGRGAEAYPASVRADWAQDLLEWFEHYLKGTGPKPPLHVEIQDNMGGWRVEGSYPPRDAVWTDVPMSDMTKLHSGENVVVGVNFLGLGEMVGTANALRFEIPAFSEDEVTRIAGPAQFHVTVTPTGPGGQLFARLSDAETGLRLGHAIMDLRFAAGGNTMQPVVPGMPIVAKMEFFAFDAVLPAGHGLVLEILPTGEDYLPSIVSSPVIVDAGAASVLRLPIVERGPEVFFLPPGVSSTEETAETEDDVETRRS